MTAIARLRALPVCAGLDEEALRVLCTLSHECDFAPGTWLLRQGEPASYAYAITQGEVAVLRTLPGGGELALAEVGAGSLVGEIGLLAETHRIASVRALTAVHVIKFERAVFTAACRMRQPAARTMLHSVINRLCQTLRLLATEMAEYLPPATPWTPSTRPAETLFDYAKFLPLLRCAPSFGEAGLREFAARSTPRALAQGEILFDAQAPSDGVALVVRGATESVAMRERESQALQVFGPGSMCGLPAALDGQPLGLRLRAREQSLVLHLPQASFDEVWQATDEFGFSLLAVVAEQLADSMPRLVNRLAQQVGLHRAQLILARGVG
jgi:hypothetical protein